MLLLLGFYRCCIFFYLFFFLSNIFSFLTGLSSLLGPLGFWHLALPVGVCSRECNNNNNNNTARRSTRIHGDHFVSFADFCVSLTRHSHRVMFLGHLTRRVTGLTYCPPPRSSRTLSFELTYSHDSVLDASCDRHSVAVSLAPSLTVAMTPCYCGALSGLYVWLAP